MKPTSVFIFAALFGCSAPEDAVEKPGEGDLTKLERKLLGTWKRQTPCAGDFLFRADGTYELAKYGPGGVDRAGVWKVRWGALPPTLVLTCTTSTSEWPSEVGQITEVKLLRLDDEGLAVDHGQPVHGQPSESVERYARVMEIRSSTTP